jgi:hypothetical protein
MCPNFFISWIQSFFIETENAPVQHHSEGLQYSTVREEVDRADEIGRIF